VTVDVTAEKEVFGLVISAEKSAARDTGEIGFPNAACSTSASTGSEV
jgi:hypothetical protein